MNTSVRIALSLAAVALLVTPVLAQHEEHHPGAAATEEADLPEKCAMMKQHMDQMQAKMQEKDAELQTLTNEMNTASGNAKVDALARVVTKMVQQRQEMHQMHGEMMQKMMAHMGEHMMQGGGPAAKKPMMECPMMQSMGKGMMSGADVQDDDDN